jgi:hypothetical protein
MTYFPDITKIILIDVCHEVSYTRDSDFHSPEHGGELCSVILFPSILTESCVSPTTAPFVGLSVCRTCRPSGWLWQVLYLVLLVVAICVAACVFPRECFGLCCVVLLSMLVFSLVVALSTFEHRTYVGTIIHTVTMASTHNTKVEFPNCIVRRVFFSRAPGPYIFFAKNNMQLSLGCDLRQVPATRPQSLSQCDTTG